MKQLPLKYIAISELKPAPYNPRDISEHAFEGLKESIKKFGFVDPVIVNTRTGLLVSGHQRLKAAEAIGMEVVPCVEVDLSPSAEKALNVTLNNQAISGYYTDSVQELLTEIREEFSDEFLNLLRLDSLVVSTDWSADADAMDKIDPNLDGIVTTIKVECPQDRVGEVKDAINEAIAAFDGVNIK